MNIFFRLTLIISFTLISLGTFGQSNGSSEGPYLFPMNPHNRNYLAGTMGELRSTHFHGGLDIKTGGVEGWDVYAAADGYVSRIKVSTSGYGNVLYLNHANGYSTVYAHLSEFGPEIAEWVRKKQYEQKTFEIELFPEANQFKFNKGELIALSGNSGSSSGPHLHFEIRDEKERPINPLFNYYKNEIVDDIPPTLYEIAFEPLSKDSRINGLYKRLEVRPSRRGNEYVINENINIEGPVGIEVKAFDKFNGIPNQNGVPIVQLLEGEKTIFDQSLNYFSFADQRDILIHTNYEAKVNGGGMFNKLYIEDDNPLPFYDRGLGKGAIQLGNGSTKNYKIILKDAYGNASVATFNLSGEKVNSSATYTPTEVPYEITRKRNNLIISTPRTESPDSITVFSGFQKHYETPAYETSNAKFYLWDLNWGAPDSAHINGSSHVFNFVATIPNRTSYKFFSKTADISFPYRSCFDTLQLEYFYKYDSANSMEEFHVGDEKIPLRKSIAVTLKPKNKYSDKAGVYRIGKNGRWYSYEGGKKTGDAFTFYTRYFGDFTIKEDNDPPAIKPITVNQNSLRFVIDDDMSGIDTYNLYINGEWVLMKYDYKKKVIESEKLNPNIPFKGKLLLKVTDNAGNLKEYSTNL
ncbi:M23 family metallopeptidase [Marinigracilibium pacificum]|uniref:M23 family metallopeptidase n=1 Tax=Marinigracilibium pacificum TaxID=2729599 RepID=A0A848IY65_9BACT|nr:M23 family metallopeptidase [Marinigracilibium pacificum]NMM48108.1 M23 family metallopeptidase [Marinigracilibium pacificum]